MESISSKKPGRRQAHDWLRTLRVAFAPGPSTPLLDEAVAGLLGRFRSQGHEVLPAPGPGVDLLLTTAPFLQPVNWREALLFTARRRFKLDHAPLVFTLVHAKPGQLSGLLAYLEKALEKAPPDPADFKFPGLTSNAYHTLYEQGRRGGPLLALVRLLQSQAMSIRIILLVGEDQPREAYTFDLVGAYPRTPAEDRCAFYDDLVLRMATAGSTDEVTQHQVRGEAIPKEVWQTLNTPSSMRRAGRELGKRGFFTEMVRIANLVNVPAVQEAVSSQYSEGCFATWDPVLGALIATVTGSARPVEKDNLTDDELAVIRGVRPDGLGAIVGHVEGKRNDSPSSEAVEMVEMDAVLPRIYLGPEWNLALYEPVQVPMARSKLHGHRGVRSFDPRYVEHVMLDLPYYDYPVSCSTQAQARGIRAAFARSQALNQPDDLRQIIFTVLPGHGVMIVEKWAAGKEPFQLIWEYMDAGRLEVVNSIPQGRLAFEEDGTGRMALV